MQPADLRAGNKKRIRAHAQQAYARGAPIWTNPMSGGEALWWRDAYVKAQSQRGQVYTTLPMLPRTQRIKVLVRGRVTRTPTPMQRIALAKGKGW